eukprot:2929557-Prymnesium_polylepis.1
MRDLAIEEVDDDDDDEAPLSAEAEAAYAQADAVREEGNALFSEGRYEDAMAKYGAALGALHGASAAEEALAAKCLNNRAAC